MSSSAASAPAEPIPDRELPAPFGPYVLLERLARGGMGEVYVGKHGGLQGFEKQCVVKTLRADLADQGEYLTRFTEEARVVVQLSHRGVCSVFDVGRVDGQLYVAMEHVMGRDLRTVIADARLPTALAIHVISEVLEALDYAHRFVDASTDEHLGVVHRDVSPHNILVSAEGDVKLIDFGIATSTRVASVVEPGVVLGKMTYMSPEHARGEELDGRSDQYSAAVLLTELLVGARFYEGIAREELPRVAGHGGHRPAAFAILDPELRAILDRALAPAREARFSSSSELGAALVSWARRANQVADARDLRRMMQQLYPDLARDERARARRFVDVHPPGLDVVTASPGFETIATTMMVAPPTTGLAEPVSTVVVRDRKQPLVEPRRSRAPWLLSAALGIAVVALGVVVVGGTFGAPEDPSPRAPPAPPPVAAVVAETPAPMPVEPRPPEPRRPEPVVAAVDAGLDASAPDDEREPRPIKRPVRPKVRLDASVERDYQAILANKDCMARLPCASGVREWRKSRDLSAPALREQFSDMVRGCAKDCRLLR